MSIIHSQNIDQSQNAGIVGNDDFENDDLITFQHDSKTIHLYYSQLTKYSKHIRDSYLMADVINSFPQEIHKFQEEFQLLPENLDYFFQLLQQNYEINEEASMTYTQCIDLLKISKYLEVRKLLYKIDRYINDQKVNVDFAIQMIQYELKIEEKTKKHSFDISEDIEQVLTSRINECLSNSKFKELPIQIIHRVISKSSTNSINNNKLFDIIINCINKNCVLLQFLDLQKLSEDRLEDLCEIYSKSDENTLKCFNYLKCNLNLIKGMNKNKKSLVEMNDEQRNKTKELETLLQTQINDSEKVNAKLQSQLDDSNNLINEQQNKMKDLEEKIISLQNQLETLLQTKINDSEKVNAKLQSQLDDSNNLINEQQNKMKDLEEKIISLQNQITDSKELENQLNQLKEKEMAEFDEHPPFEGQIVASADEGICINAEINLTVQRGILDTTNSKVIISTSDAKKLGSEAYEKGEPITSLHVTTKFACKIGKYYVRCIVFNTDGESNEIVSNSVTMSASSLTFEYKGREPTKISLPQGQYKLEVWGAKGGDSNGTDNCNYDKKYNKRSGQTVQGGLGGYSRGILNLKKEETIYIYVGEEGQPSNSSEGLSTKGGFPDGGDTRTGHCHSSCPVVPGTGGGSTSIRIGNETDYARVIVAGGGGGASGDHWTINPGGFGGGVNGGNCFFKESLQKQGAGMLAGSSPGLGESGDRHGDLGKFGLGATGNYIHGADSGGGGGGGWYGGGSGGAGKCIYCSSGGGGSGWTFTESNLKKWKEGDSSNASKFLLTSDYYLTDTVCVGGNEEFPRPDGNGNEQGHSGNGYAKITFI